MIRLLGKLPNKPIVAISGGVDSVAAADFLSRARDIRCAFFHHGTEASELGYRSVSKLCRQKNWQIFTEKITQNKPSTLSPEEFWRNQRYEWLDSLNDTVITAHHLDDSVETYIWSALHGTAKIIPYQRTQVIRPFLLTRKCTLIDWAIQHNLPWVQDPSNNDETFARNYVRNNVVPVALKVNPGIHKMVAKKIQKQFEDK